MGFHCKSLPAKFTIVYACILKNQYMQLRMPLQKPKLANLIGSNGPLGELRAHTDNFCSDPILPQIWRMCSVGIHSKNF